MGIRSPILLSEMNRAIPSASFEKSRIHAPLCNPRAGWSALRPPGPRPPHPPKKWRERRLRHCRWESLCPPAGRWLLSL